MNGEQHQPLSDPSVGSELSLLAVPPPDRKHVLRLIDTLVERGTQAVDQGRLRRRRLPARGVAAAAAGIPLSGRRGAREQTRQAGGRRRRERRAKEGG